MLSIHSIQQSESFGTLVIGTIILSNATPLESALEYSTRFTESWIRSLSKRSVNPKLQFLCALRTKKEQLGSANLVFMGNTLVSATLDYDLAKPNSPQTDAINSTPNSGVDLGS